MGSTTALTDGSGTVTGAYEYDAFGNERAQSGATTEWAYTGEQKSRGDHLADSPRTACHDCDLPLNRRQILHD